MPYFLYILYSATKDKYYVGQTGDNLMERLRRHNTNHKGFSGRTGDWIIVYNEVYTTKSEAYKRENKSKHGKAAK